ncbi:anillin-like [Teleopsis dalmanni]|nr:anillin-like [Teleopsis dalmanni]
MTNNDVEVQVEVEERDITDSEEDCEDNSKLPKEAINQPLAKIRDTSRNRLQRLGALYSNTDDLSSPIHRTEAQFHAGSSDDACLNDSPSKSKQRYGRLAALANSINQWEDDTQHHHINTIPPPKPDLPSRKLADTAKNCQKITQSQATVPNQTTEEVKQNDSCDRISSSKTKQLNWDPKVINSLEAQGFQRRESTTTKLAYDYTNKECNVNRERDLDKQQKEQTKLCTNPVNNNISKNLKNTVNEELEKPKLANVKPGLVSGRAAVFEHKAATANQQLQRPQKDPTELSLKERLQLFERNKGEALVPKAAFGMAPSISKILQDKKEEAKSITSHAQIAPPVCIKSNVGDCKVRDKVAALVANAKTISESKIKADIYKQRQEDMQILANRANQQKELFEKNMEIESNTKTVSAGVQSEFIKNKTAALIAASSVVRPSPPPPPPPMPKFVSNQLTAKRRSPGNTIDDESKRAKKSNVPLLSSHNIEAVQPKNQLYPALSDLESNDSESYIDNCCTTATVSAGDAAEDDNENESYVESEEAEDSSVGICDGSLGREIMQVVKHNEHNSHEKHEQMQSRSTKEVRYADNDSYYYGGVDSSINSSEASVGVDDYLDAALDENEDGDDDYSQESEYDECNLSYASGRSKGTTTSNSFSFRKTSSKNMQWETIPEENSGILSNTTKSQADTSVNSNFKQPIKSELSINQEDDNMVTLVHTVSFYRRQQNSANSTPVRKICREQQVLRSAIVDHGSAAARLNFDTPQKFNENELSKFEPDDGEVHTEDELDNDDLVQEKIKKLLDEVCKQQQVIAQTSQALNLCASTIEFSGSVESVEGERHLLVATHRRQACLDEVQRLRVERSLRPLGAPKEKGRLTVKDITFRLREDYMRKLAAGTISGHHLLCLLKYNEHVLATKTVQTFPGALSVQFNDVLHMNDVYADFRITLEIYGMTAHHEVLAHEVKYHINMNKKCGIKTPKKKGAENVLVLPPRQSPAGPNVVRTPALVQYAFAIFSLREIQRTEWTLTQVLGVSPLAGVVKMKVNCELSVTIKHKGFLTMFEDVTGYGAWHRRWAYLNGTVLNYWKYPDDEKKKAPMGTIDLYTCTSQNVSVAPRDICARLNTLLLECQRPAKETDKQSLIIVPNGRTTTVRHLLSADTKEEREEWCAYFNKTLTLIRAWGPPQ